MTSKPVSFAIIMATGRVGPESPRSDSNRRAGEDMINPYSL